MKVAVAVGQALTAAGVRQVFGVVGSGNFHLTNAMVAAGARFVAARHEGGAATMADAYSRMSGTVAALSVHQGCGLTNAMTGIAEAAKSRTPMLVVAAEATEPRSNFHVDQDALARSVGAVPVRITSAETAVAEAQAAVATAVRERRTVLLNVPLSLQALETAAPVAEPRPSRNAVVPDAAEVAALTDLLRRAERPVFVAGRGARGHRKALESLAERCGALLATSAVAHGLFHGNPWDLGISGGFASPRTAELIRDADLIVGWGCALNMWTMRHGQLIGPDATVVQVDDDASALGVHREIQLGVTGDVELTATLALEAYGEQQVGYRAAELGSVRWRDVVAFDDESTGERIDPRTLSIALDDMLPAERVLAVDSGNFMGYPSVCLSVPDENGFCFTQAFQSIGLGLATAIGAALAQPDRLPVAVLGDGGALMSAVELDTVRRLGLPMLVVVYNDDAYGAEVHHFGPGGHALETVTFPPTDIAAIGRGYGFEAVIVRGVDDLAAVASWLNGPRSAPMLVDAKVVAEHPSWWLEEAFRGH
ncbi:thiamine pyrophosphate-dependent acetolactate synthase large subunit-like protein [Kribbella sp. VKM Ac-2569]|uniref:thiamine pyrophosphate-binding protein n=1 Tax=Kribbella sp. VKM Ac-2569 TaxID=2512220 RepID=UPI00102BC72E|nr:thiamine pyrophosphate-binding protein [Kribbella sp. VKM Ac-2569]RZT26507.1 thiamine pyrophosphate-dependent acetolactate synthase large subunit-like protein [Kribbella sp. VKM Ac-2569]